MTASTAVYLIQSSAIKFNYVIWNWHQLTSNYYRISEIQVETY